MAEEKKPNSPPKKPSPQAGAKAKKPKPPAVEDKPFTEFIEQDFIPTLQDAVAKAGIDDMTLNFVRAPLPIEGTAKESCWQVQGSWDRGELQFNLYFPEETIKGQKGFSFATNGAQPSILESFMIDERKVTLGLMVMYVLQRLNGQKLLARN